MFSLIATVVVIGDVTKCVIMPSKTPQTRIKPASPIGYLTGQNTPVSNFFCQQSLTENLFWVQNKDNYFSKKMGNLGKLGDGLKVLAAATMLTGAAEAQETNGNIVLAAASDTSIQVRDCQTEVKAFREQLQAEGVDRSELKDRVRAEMATCRHGNIATQEIEIARLDSEFLEMKAWLQARGLDVNEAGHITDPQGRLLAVIEAETTELRESTAELRESTAELRESTAALRANTRETQLRIDTLDEEYQQILDEFRTFLNRNA